MKRWHEHDHHGEHDVSIDPDDETPQDDPEAIADVR